MDAYPDRWYRMRHPQLYAETIPYAAEVVGSDPKDVVIVENVTSGN